VLFIVQATDHRPSIWYVTLVHMIVAILPKISVAILANICMLHIVQHDHSSITDVKVHHKHLP